MQSNLTNVATHCSDFQLFSYNHHYHHHHHHHNGVFTISTLLLLLTQKAVGSTVQAQQSDSAFCSRCTLQMPVKSVTAFYVNALYTFAIECFLCQCILYMHNRVTACFLCQCTLHTQNIVLSVSMHFTRAQQSDCFLCQCVLHVHNRVTAFCVNAFYTCTTE